MAISFHDTSVTTYLQIINAASGFLEKGRAHCAENNIDLDEVVETRLYPDMNPFRFQVISIAHHSMGAIRGIDPPESPPPSGYGDPDYEGLQALVAEAKEVVAGYDKATVDGFEGKSMVFKLGGNELPFIAENFVLSFSLPNLFFHATTAYDILRMKGVPLGKRDYLGALRMGTD